MPVLSARGPAHFLLLLRNAITYAAFWQANAGSIVDRNYLARHAAALLRLARATADRAVAAAMVAKAADLKSRMDETGYPRRGASPARMTAAWVFVSFFDRDAAGLFLVWRPSVWPRVRAGSAEQPIAAQCAFRRVREQCSWRWLFLSLLLVARQQTRLVIECFMLFIRACGLRTCFSETHNLGIWGAPNLPVAQRSSAVIKSESRLRPRSAFP
jgi:hypothetical protein